ncbi:hypothetical protein HPP92_013916 [Vanilla planifolia]|uniref:Legume lectin domain-containing protein n=1 Tax=Vanilla planifolia TaxID=51239 RepID=A0A835UYX3_VANPL|nr:hypothetical protein HPP92_013916 [Vanilla planifolia]
MAVPLFVKCSSVFVILVLCLEGFLPRIQGSEVLLSFAFDGFVKNGSLNSALALYGDAQVEGSAVRMTHVGATSGGKLLYRKPIKFLPGNPGFSTYLCFSVSPAQTNSLAFFLDSADWRLFPRPKNALLVEFASNVSGSSIGIRVRLDSYTESCNFSSDSLLVSDSPKLHSWVDYDGLSKRIEVKLSKSRALQPSTPFISCPVDLSNFLQNEALTVGILSSSSEHVIIANDSSTRGSFIYSWSFTVNHGVPYLMHSEPLDPRTFMAIAQHRSRVHLRKSFGWLTVMSWLFGLVCGALIACLVVFMWNIIARRRPVVAVDFPVHPEEVTYEKVMMVGENRTKAAPVSRAC